MVKKFSNTCRLVVVLGAVAGSVALIGSNSAQAQDYASIQRDNAAMGHYARARTMLVEALAEFEQGRKIARPDMLIDPEEFRISLISRTEELNRVLDPKPRVTREGVRFSANPLLIRRERDRTPRPDEMAKENSYEGEEERRIQKRVSRAAMNYNDDKVQVEAPAGKVNTKPAINDSALKESVRKSAEKAIEERAAAAAAPEVIKTEETTQSVTIEQPAPAKNSDVRVIENEEVPVGTTTKVETTKTETVTQAAPTPAPEPSKAQVKEEEDAVSKVVDEIVKERLNAASKGAN